MTSKAEEDFVSFSSGFIQCLEVGNLLNYNCGRFHYQLLKTLDKNLAAIETEMMTSANIKQKQWF